MAGILRACLTLSAALLSFSLVTPAQSAEYSVDGWKLGGTVTGPALQSYSCRPSSALAQLTSCTRTQMRNRGYNYSAFGTVMHDESGATIFLKVKVSPVQIKRDEIEREIVQLSGELGSKPASVDWTSAYGDQPTSVIAQWGHLKLEAIDSNANVDVEAGKYPAMDMLVDTIGDAQRSVKAGMQVYRILGGTGYIYSA